MENKNCSKSNIFNQLNLAKQELGVDPLAENEELSFVAGFEVGEVVTVDRIEVREYNGDAFVAIVTDTERFFGAKQLIPVEISSLKEVGTNSYHQNGELVEETLTGKITNFKQWKPKSTTAKKFYDELGRTIVKGTKLRLAVKALRCYIAKKAGTDFATGAPYYAGDKRAFYISQWEIVGE